MVSPVTRIEKHLPEPVSQVGPQLKDVALRERKSNAPRGDDAVHLWNLTDDSAVRRATPTDAIQHSELLFWNFASAPRYGAGGFVVMVPDEGLRSNPRALPSVSSSSPGKAKFFDKGRSEESTEPATERRNQGNLNAAEVDNSPAQPRILFVPNVACCTGRPQRTRK